MSLINEALKRARHDSARREAEAKGLPQAVPPGQVFGRRGPRQPLVAVVAVVGAVALGAVFYFAGQRAAQRDSGQAGGLGIAELNAPAPPATVNLQPGASLAESESKASVAADPSAAAPSNARTVGDEATRAAATEPGRAAAPPTPAEPAPRPAPGGGSTRPPTPRSETGTPANRSGSAAARPGPASGPPSAPRSPAAASSRASQTPPSEPAEPAATGVAPVSDPSSGVILLLPEQDRPAAAQAPRPAEGGAERGGAASYIQRFTTPDGGTIELGGIAWSETGPFALINGQVLGAGSTVHGFVIERIHPRQVELRGAGGTVFLTLQ